MRLLKAALLILILQAFSYAGDMTVPSMQLLNWQKPAPQVWVFYSTTFTASDSTLVPAGNPQNKNAYLRITCSIIGTTVTIPQHVIKSTRDGLDNQTSLVSYSVFTTAGAEIVPNPLAPYTNMAIPATITSATGCSPTGTCGSLSELKILQGNLPPPPPPQFYDAATIDRMIAAQLSGAPAGAMYILKSANAILTNAFAMDTLGTGLVKNNAGTPSIGVAGTDYQAPIGATAPITFVGSTVAIPVATSSANGYLSSTDWSTFNSKQVALGFTAENAANKNATNGYAGLSSGKVALGQLQEVLAPADLTGISGVQGTGTQIPVGTLSGIANGQTIIWDSGTGNFLPGSPGAVTSVAATVPSGFTVTGSPITTSGTLAIAYATGQTQNSVLATPDGSSGALSIRVLLNGDLPVVNAAHGGSGLSSYTTFNILASGTTGTGSFQQISPDTSGKVLTSNGVGVLPTFQTLPAASAHNLLSSSHSDTSVSSPPTRGSVIAAKNSGTASWSELLRGTQYQVLQANATDTVFDAVHLDQTAAVTGSLTVPNGGTGAATFTANAVLYGNGTGAVQGVVGGATTLCLQETDGGAPFFGTCAGSASTAWSALASPGSNLSLAMLTRTSIFTWGTGTAADGLLLQDTTGSVSTNHIFSVTSVGTSTQKPVLFCSKGTTDCVEMSAAANFGPIGAATLTANVLAGVGANGIIAQTTTGNFEARTITAGVGIGVADGDGVAGDPTLTLTLGTLVASQSIWDGSQASRTLTANLSGTDPVITFGSSSVDVTTGTLKQGGTGVVLESRTLTNGTGINTLGDLSANRTVSIDQSFAPTWTGVHTFTPALRTSGAAAYLTVNAPADTGLTASTEAIGINHVGAIRQHATGALTTNREYVFAAPTYSFAGSSTLTNAATVAIAAAPTAGTNATITNAYALWVQAGASKLDGRLLLSPTPVYDLASNVLATSLLMSHSSVTVAASAAFYGIRMSQSDGSADSFTVGASGFAGGIGVFYRALSGSDSSSALYAGVIQADNAGPGTVKALHVLATGVTGSTGVLTGASFDVAPVTGQGATFAVQVATSGITAVSRGIIFTTNNSTNFNYGIDFLGFASSPGYTTAAIRLPNNTVINARNAAGSGDISVIRLNASNEIELGAAGASVGVVNLAPNAYFQVGSTAAGVLFQFIDSDGRLRFFKQGVGEFMNISAVGNVKINGTATRGTTEGTAQLVLFNGTAPVGTLTNGASFYAASGEMRVMDASGNSTLLSPHDHETNEWIFYSKNTVTGKVLRIDIERMMRFLNARFGTDFIKEFYESPQQESRPQGR